MRVSIDMRVFLLRALFLAPMLPVACHAQLGFAEVRVVALRQIQSLESPAGSGSHIGIRFVDIDANRAAILKLGEDRGVEVKAVEEGSSADKAGIQPGDVLLSYNGENILGGRQLIRLVQETPPGRKIKIQFWRAGKARFMTVMAGSVPPDTSQPIPGFLLPDGRVYPRTATIVPRPILVWRDVLLGMDFEELDSQLGEYFGVPGGVLIRAVERGSPADKSGLKPGDVIVSVRQINVLTAHDFTSCLRKTGSSASLTLVRNHKKLDAKLTFTASEQ